MKALTAFILFALGLAPFATAAQSSSSPLPPATPLLGSGICGKGTFVLTLGKQPAGREAFEIICKQDGSYSASGRTEFTVPGANVDLTTTLDVDKAGLPLSSTTKGTVAGQPFDQAVEIRGDQAILVTSGSRQELPYARGTALLGSNIFFMVQFVAALYDTNRGGQQPIPVLPNQTAKLERVGRDTVTPASSSTALSFDRYSIALGPVATTAWFDQRGRLAVFSVPMQQFVVAREEYTSLVEALGKASKGSSGEIDYSAPAGAPFSAEEVTIQAKEFTLAGTLLIPKSAKRPLPVAITITGSGQQTRDERIPIAGLEKYRPFGQIAEALAANGIAVLRVDDRGVGKSGGRETLTTATSADFADDVRAQIDYLRKRPEIDANRIALIGHSEGGIIAPMVAASDPRITAIVLLAGSAKTGEEILNFQYSNAIDPKMASDKREKLLAERRQLLKTVKEGGDMSKVPQAFKVPWLVFFIGYDPLPTLRKVNQPVLIMHGALDMQVTVDQATTLSATAREAGNKDVTLKLYPNLNHLFLPAKTGHFDEYSSLATSQVADDVLGPLVEWLSTRLKSK